MASRLAGRPIKTAASAARLGRRNLATPAAAPPLQEKDCRSITPPYEKLLTTLQNVRDVLPRGTKLTLAEKILYSHVRSAEDLAGAKDLSDIRGQRYLKLAPDRVAMQVSSGTMLRNYRAEESISVGRLSPNGPLAIHVVRPTFMCGPRVDPLRPLDPSSKGRCLGLGQVDRHQPGDL
jgi:hypothetical protein